MEEYIRNEIKEMVVYWFLGILTTIAIPLFFGFSLLGFEDSFVRGASLEFGSLIVTLIIYIIFTVGTLFLPLIFTLASIVTIKKGEDPATQPNPTWFRIFTVSYLFSPEKGVLYKLFESSGYPKNKNPFRFGLNYLRMILISILIFWLVGILSILNPSLQATGVPTLKAQQVTVTNQVLFISLLPAWAETMMLLFALFFVCGIFAYFTSKFIKDRKMGLYIYLALSVIIGGLLMAGIWASFHRIVYGNSEIALISTLVFGFIGSLMTLMTGTFIPFWIWHLFNNIYASLNVLVPSNEDIIFISFLLWGLFFLLYLIFEFINYKFRKTNTPENSF